MTASDRYVILLRGINVGGHNKVPMADLRTALGRVGFDDVSTYIQSGNVLASVGKRDEAAVVADVEKVMADQFGLTIPVVVRAASDWAAILAANPFPQAEAEPKFLHVSLCHTAPETEAVDAMDLTQFDPDQMAVVGRNLYLWYPEGSARSKLNGALLERKLNVTTTARNWSTMKKLAELIDAQT